VHDSEESQETKRHLVEVIKSSPSLPQFRKVALVGHGKPTPARIRTMKFIELINRTSIPTRASPWLCYLQRGNPRHVMVGQQTPWLHLPQTPHLFPTSTLGAFSKTDRLVTPVMQLNSLCVVGMAHRPQDRARGRCAHQRREGTGGYGQDLQSTDY
jgi:hypothetical protein